MLSDDELARYARHIVLADVGGPGQQKLKAAKVLVIGAGGLGSPVLLYLAAAGVGTLGVVDNDTVSLSNLQRQVLHGTPDVGKPKVLSAADALVRLNPHVQTLAHNKRLKPKNAEKIIAQYDIVADGCDNFDTRYLVADICHRLKKPLVSAAVGQFDGTVTTFRSFEHSADGNPNPTYYCLFPEAPPPGMAPACEEAGVLGALTGMIGSLQAMEVIKEICGVGESLVGRLLTYDARAARFAEFRYVWDPANPLNGQSTD